MGVVKRGVLLLLMIGLLLGGCWDNREPKRRAFAIGMGIDPSEEQEGWLTVTLQIPVAFQRGGGGGGQTQAPADYYWITGEGQTVFGAVQEMQDRVSREIFFGQLRSLVISAALTAKQVETALESIVRNPDIEESIYMVLTQGSALELMQVRTEQERFPALYLNSVFESVRRDTVTVPVKLWEFWRNVHTPGWEPILPVANTEGNELTLTGLAVFKETEYRGGLNAFEAEGYTYFMGRTATGTLTIETEKGVAMIRSLQANQTMRISFVGNRPVFHVSLDVTGELARPPGRQISTEAVYAEIAQGAQENIQKRIDALLKKAQQEYQSDILGLGRRLRYRYPNYFQQVKWDKLFPEVEIRVEVDVDITRKGILSQAPVRGWAA